MRKDSLWGEEIVEMRLMRNITSGMIGVRNHESEFE
jgi:hypothetical protein